MVAGVQVVRAAAAAPEMEGEALQAIQDQVETGPAPLGIHLEEIEGMLLLVAARKGEPGSNQHLKLLPPAIKCLQAVGVLNCGEERGSYSFLQALLSEACCLLLPSRK